MSQEESFDKEFQTLRELGEQTFVLRGSTMIVWELPEPEVKTKSGLIVATDRKQVLGNSVEQGKLKVAKVLMTGPGYYDDSINEVWNNDGAVSELASKGGYIPLDIKPGAIVILPQFSTSTISIFPGINKPTSNKLHMVKEDSVLAYFPSEEAFNLAQSKLN